MRRRTCLIIMMLAVVMMGFAQQQRRWKAPKRPKPPKWEVPKQIAPEVIDVWRPYVVSDNWFLELNGGVSLSMSENTAGHGLGKMCLPMFDFAIGRQVSKVWSTRLDFGIRRQRSWASKEALAASSLLGEGDYCYNLAVGYIDEVMSLTNLLCHYNERRVLDIQLFAGVGVNYSWNFQKKTSRWDKYGYPIDRTDHVNLAFRGGTQWLFKVDESVDISLQGAFNMVGDSHNGVKHSSGFFMEPYVDVSIGVKVHLMDHYGSHRYYKVRRWEANSLRAEDPKVANWLEEEHNQEYRDREASEVVAFGELMKTHVSFYIDRSFVNDYQMENLRIVADFLRKHPEVNLLIKGYCGASTRSESPDMHLAERRVASVKKALMRHFNVDESRLDTWFDEDANPPFPMKGEWIDGVVFQMQAK